VHNKLAAHFPQLPPQLRTLPPGIFAWTQGAFSQTRVIENSGEIAQFTVNPQVPQGMSINPESGIIQGAPNNVFVPTAFVITANNAAERILAEIHACKSAARRTRVNGSEPQAGPALTLPECSHQGARLR
jgi:hypothetical protein